jgi:hypothetical protein
MKLEPLVSLATQNINLLLLGSGDGYEKEAYENTRRNDILYDPVGSHTTSYTIVCVRRNVRPG